MTKGPPAARDRVTDPPPPPPVPALMYPAAEVDACIQRLQATIARLERELADALARLAPPVCEAMPEVDEPEPSPEPDRSGDLVGDFLDALHEPGPGLLDGREGNFR